MDEYFVIPELAIQLKELGFDYPCLRGFNNGTEFKTVWPVDYNKGKVFVSIPLYPQAFKWIREVHNIKAFIVPSYQKECEPYSFTIGRVSFSEKGYATVQEAEQACLTEMINIIYTFHCEREMRC